jgi:hypothetical protein
MKVFGIVVCLVLLGATNPKPPAVKPPPLVRIAPPVPPVITTVTSPTPSWEYGAWTTRDMGDFTIASTVNESGSAFGAVCGKNCVWFVNFQSECKAGDEYPAMINGPSGSYAIELRCYHLDKYRLLTFSMTNDSLNILAKNGEVGFAFPFAGGKFGVSRFSLEGAENAVLKALDIINARRQGNQEGLRDFTI